MIPRSGNHLVDRMDDDEDRNDRESRLMDCGCICGNCTCDVGWDRNE